MFYASYTVEMEILHEKILCCRLSIVRTKCLTVTMHYRTFSNFLSDNVQFATVILSLVSHTH